MLNNLIIDFCSSDREWREYHRIRKEQIFDPLGVEYNPSHPSITANNHYHLVLYNSVKIVATAHIEFLNENEAALRSLAVDASWQNKGFGKYMMWFLENWLRDQNINVLKMHARLSAENFYRKLGYVDMEFNDASIQKNYTDLGKML